jgi:hypothetical protein
MAKKYVYLKLFQSIHDLCESESLSPLELTPSGGQFEDIQNVLQLYSFIDLKLLITKSDHLQNLLTGKLPGPGCRHGYLWNGEELPGIDRLLKHGALFQEAFLFLKSGDVLPHFFEQPLFRLADCIPIYNWQVYHLFSFQSIYEQAIRIRKYSQNENDIDQGYDNLWQHIKNTHRIANDWPFTGEKVKPQKVAEAAPFRVDKRSFSEPPDAGWLRALMNYLGEEKGRMLYCPFVASTGLVQEVKLAGMELQATELNPIRFHYARAQNAFSVCSLTELRQVLSALREQVDLMTRTDDRPLQFNLFQNETERQFEAFWEAERERLKRLEFKHLDESVSRMIALLRFLIESQSISKSVVINAILLAALLNLCAKMSGKPLKSGFRNGLDKELQRLYLDVYAFRQIKELAGSFVYSSEMYNENALENGSLLPQSADAALALFPSKLKHRGFSRKDRFLIDLLNIPANVESLQGQRVGLPVSDKEQMDAWAEQVRSRGPKYESLGSAGLKELRRFEQANRYDDAGCFLKYWIDGYLLLKKLAYVLKDRGKGCLIIRNSFYKFNHNFEEVKTSAVLQELLNKHRTELDLHLLDTFEKRDYQQPFGHHRNLHLLLFSKGG